jgi:hypothetical protein
VIKIDFFTALTLILLGVGVGLKACARMPLDIWLVIDYVHLPQKDFNFMDDDE